MNNNATSKQVQYIDNLLLGSTTKYDYIYDRDKGLLSSKVAGAFIQAIRDGKQFNYFINNHSELDLMEYQLKTMNERQEYLDSIF